MRTPSVLAACAALAPGRRLVVQCSGKSYALPAEVQPVIEAENPMSIAAAQIAQSAETNRQVVEAMARQVAQTIERVEREIAEGNERVAQSLMGLSAALYLPVRPIYDASGHLIGAERVKPGDDT